MDFALRIRNRYTRSIETLFDLPGKIPVDGPIIPAFGPRAAHKFDRAVGQFIHLYDWLRYPQHQRMRSDYLFDKL
jgi:hypothetical protein